MSPHDIFQLGGIAQLVERVLCMHKVWSSILHASTLFVAVRFGRLLFFTRLSHAQVHPYVYWSSTLINREKDNANMKILIYIEYCY